MKKIIILLINYHCFCIEHHIAIEIDTDPLVNSNHWINKSTNSAIHIENIELDVYQWRIACSNYESIEVIFENSIWQI